MRRATTRTTSVCIQPVKSLVITPRQSFSSLPSFYRRNSEHSWGNSTEKFSWSLWHKGLSMTALLAAPLAFFATNQASADEQEKGNDDQEGQQKSSTEETQERKESKKGGVEVDMEVKYLIIGGGAAAAAAYETILKLEPDAKILMVAGENVLPYQRPPLSKNLWKTDDSNVATNLKYKDWEGNETSIWLQQESFYGKDTIKLGTKATQIEPASNRVLLSDGTIVKYSKCLIASGGTPRALVKGNEKVTTYRTVEDFIELEKITNKSKHIVVIGGGFLGSELATSLAEKGKKTGLKITQVFPESGLMELAIPKYLSDYTTDRMRSELGYTILPNKLVKSFDSNGDGSQLVLTLDSGEKIEADHAVVAAGIIPNTEVAKDGDGLEIDRRLGGIVVNSELAALSDIYAAGDVASFYDINLKDRRRIEHWDHAVHSGITAAKNMMGAKELYTYQPFFWSDVGSIGYEAVGILDSKLQTIGVWDKTASMDSSKPDFRKGIVYYLRDGHVVGVLLWNVWHKVEEAKCIF